jgi:hypothetical protein
MRDASNGVPKPGVTEARGICKSPRALQRTHFAADSLHRHTPRAYSGHMVYTFAGRCICAAMCDPDGAVVKRIPGTDRALAIQRTVRR